MTARCGGFVVCMDNLNDTALNNDPMSEVENALRDGNQETPTDPLALDIPDKDLKEIVPERIKTSRKWFEEKYHLSARRSKNETYRFGRQADDLFNKTKLKEYETRSGDNVLYEIEGSLKALATSKIADIIITPGGDDPERIQSADDLTKAIDTQNKKREQKEMLGIAFEHLPTYLTAVLKARWDSEKGKEGDYRFDVINPEYIVVDHTATSRNPDDMSFIAQCVPMTVQDAIMRFPSKKNELLEAMKFDSILSGNEPTYKEMATEIKVWEVWFDWYKKKGKAEVMTKTEMQDSIFEPGIEWERISGTLWMYTGGDRVILKKMLDPNYDHEGESKMMAYQDPADENSKKEVDMQQIMLAQLMGEPTPDVMEEQVYHNYFTRPHKPYFFMGYDQWGKSYLDETSRIEQNLRNQENLDDQNRTVLDQVKKRVKHIWSKESGLGKGDVQRLDMDNPKIDAMVEGDPNTVHKSIEPERPDAAQFNARNSTQDRMYAISHTTAIRGSLQSDTATSNQIGREGDFSVTDDLTDATVTAACEWMSEWQLQFIKLRYTEEHLRQILGDKGKTTYIRLRRDMISDGMEVMIKASSTDKLKAQRNAMETAGLGPPYTNPVDFFRDMDMSDADGRAERGMMLAIDPQGYYVKYVLKLDSANQMAQAIGQPQPGAQAPMPGQTPPAQGQQPGGQPQGPTPVDTTQVAATPPMGPPAASPRSL